LFKEKANFSRLNMVLSEKNINVCTYIKMWDSMCS
jgi:hypothetical protein